MGAGVVTESEALVLRGSRGDRWSLIGTSALFAAIGAANFGLGVGQQSAAAWVFYVAAGCMAACVVFLLLRHRDVRREHVVDSVGVTVRRRPGSRGLRIPWWDVRRVRCHLAEGPRWPGMEIVGTGVRTSIPFRVPGIEEAFQWVVTSAPRETLSVETPVRVRGLHWPSALRPALIRGAPFLVGGLLAYGVNPAITGLGAVFAAGAMAPFALPFLLSGLVPRWVEVTQEGVAVCSRKGLRRLRFEEAERVELRFRPQDSYRMALPLVRLIPHEGEHFDIITECLEPLALYRFARDRISEGASG